MQLKFCWFNNVALFKIWSCPGWSLERNKISVFLPRKLSSNLWSSRKHISHDNFNLPNLCRRIALAPGVFNDFSTMRYEKINVLCMRHGVFQSHTRVPCVVCKADVEEGFSVIRAIFHLTLAVVKCMNHSDICWTVCTGLEGFWFMRGNHTEGNFS